MRQFDSFSFKEIDYKYTYSDDIFFNFSEYAIEKQYSKELGYIKDIQNYRDNWDSYKGKAPKEDSILLSIDFLSSFTRTLKNLSISYNNHFPEFCLAGDGILGLEWDYAKNANLFARFYSSDKIEYILTENNQKHTTKEMKGADFIEFCKEKLEEGSKMAS